MSIDQELQAILDNVLRDSVRQEVLDNLHDTWLQLRNGGEVGSFKDFVYGSINGSILNLYTSYHGKNFSELQKHEKQVIDELLFNRIYGLKQYIDGYMEKSVHKT